MSRVQNVVNYYVLCNKLKNIVRTGWINWNVERERVESVAEHIYGVQMLALAMYSEYQYEVDIYKVILMLAVHELGETIIGDLTQFDISKDEKKKIERDAVKKILGDMLSGEFIESLFLEFDEKSTKEAKFAYQCDKLECDIQSKLYDQENCVDLSKQENNISYNNAVVKELLKEGISFSDMWIKFGQRSYSYDKNFLEVSNYVLNNKLDNVIENKLKKCK